MGYRTYPIEGNPALLYRPFISVYIGAAYLKWLSGFGGKYVTSMQLFFFLEWHFVVANMNYGFDTAIISSPES